MKTLKELNEELSALKEQLAAFHEENGIRPVTNAHFHIQKYLPFKDEVTRYASVVKELDGYEFSYTDEWKKLKGLAKQAMKEVESRNLRGQRARKEEFKGLVNNSKLLSQMVCKNYWQSCHRLWRFIQMREESLSEKQKEEEKTNEFLQLQLQLTESILKEIQGEETRGSFLLKKSLPQKMLTVVNLSKAKRKYVIKNVVEKEAPLKPSGDICPDLTLFKGNLRDYQKSGVMWLSTLSMKRISCILADEMGLGKTVQTIAHLSYLAQKEGIWGPHLIVVPTTVLGNWQEEFQRFLPSFKVFSYFGRSSDRKAKRKGWSDIERFHVCLTTYRIVSIDSKIFKRRKWFSLILDEAHLIKNSKTQSFLTLNKIRTFHRILLTGTPLQNKLQELWTLMNFLFPKRFGQKNNSFSNFEFYIEKAAKGNSAAYNSVIKKLHSIIRPLILRRLKKDVEKQLPLKSEVVLTVPLSIRQRILYDQFLLNTSFISLSPALSSLNSLMQLRKICNHPNLVEEKISYSPVMSKRIFFDSPKSVNLIIELKKPYFENRQGLNQSQLLGFLCLIHKSSKNQIGDPQAPLRYKKQIVKRILTNLVLPKTAQYHFEELKKIASKFEIPRKNILQNLKKFITAEEVSDYVQSNYENFIIPVVRAHAKPIYQNPFENFPRNFDFQIISPLPKIFTNNVNNFIQDSGKMRSLLSLLSKLQKEGHKVLIFTQMTKMLDFLEILLSSKNFPYVRLDGTIATEKRQAIVSTFNENPRLFAFISSTRVGGIGLNLTSADTVIFYDCDWNPAVDRQAQDRCHRIGQNRNVTVYKLVSESTIEENILMTSNMKAKMDDLVLNKGRFTLEEFLKKVSAKTNKDKGKNDAQAITNILSKFEEESDKADDNLLEENVEDESAESEASISADSNESEENEASAFTEAHRRELENLRAMMPDIYHYGINFFEELSREFLNATSKKEAQKIPTLQQENKFEKVESSDDSDQDHEKTKEILDKRKIDLSPREVIDTILESRKRVKTN